MKIYDVETGGLLMEIAQADRGRITSIDCMENLILVGG